ncbi:MAG: imidazole glycerol phosphate synthase subunit HisH [Deltaproteobacteria bacterium]|nr:imidazole glycerol phosphate synthase subunit HisH [Deltaproteobacteria bacterium]MCL4873358.1 imidazole glycerol phosphate synthase subunit HisH [bacterium]
MGPRVTILDYGMGNIFSIERAMRKLGCETVLADSPEGIAGAERLILPGVGAFGKAMEELERRDCVRAILDYAASGKPLLGICLGMQLLMREGSEFGGGRGLGIVEGRVVALKGEDMDGRRLKVPHIGWNGVCENGKEASWKGTILDGVGWDSSFYFVHSFVCVPSDQGAVLAETSYGSERFPSVIQAGNIHGCQFHPEKSGPLGLAVCRNFAFNTPEKGCGDAIRKDAGQAA